MHAPANFGTAFAVGDLVEHSSFGLGVVAVLRGPDKMDVVFPVTTKTLMHNRGGKAPQAEPLEEKRADVAVR